MSLRECGLYAATGFQGSGKSRETTEMAIDYVQGNSALGVKPRNFLILDFNNEYEKVETSRGIVHIKTLRKDQVRAFALSPHKEIRRIVPFHNGRKYDFEEMQKMVDYIFKEYLGGALLLEDLSGYYGDHLPDKFVMSLINLRHKNIDTIVHFQSTSRFVPKIKQNLKYCRLHWQSDPIDPAKVTNYELYRIAQNIVNKQYTRGIDPRTGEPTGNPFYFVYVWQYINKIKGNFTKRQFIEACYEYITQHPKTTMHLEKQKDLNGKKKYTYAQCLELKIKELMQNYYGN